MVIFLGAILSGGIQTGIEAFRWREFRQEIRGGGGVLEECEIFANFVENWGGRPRWIYSMNE